ncbi:MAG: class I SAM-dependent methyltransferase [Candidatus Heimdallarchaeota archaeon]|nr:MAG: class I SAM-dependent methyltransferase [Candidatus Heimdallarchaeota archaeon]
MNNKNSIQVGWKWEEVNDINEWKKPDGPVMRLSYSLGSDLNKKIYDLGCGVGRHTIYFARLGYQVSASDISEEAIKETKKWLNKEGLRADVQQGRMTKINQPDNTFDLVISMNVIHHAFKNDVIKTISEIHRILKPRGIFYGTIKTKEKDEVFTNKTNVIVDDQTIILKGGVEDGIPHFFFHKEDIIEFFKDFKFESLVYTELYFPPNLEEKLLSQKGSGYYRIQVRKPA